jgi:hypothetical protein
MILQSQKFGFPMPVWCGLDESPYAGLRNVSPCPVAQVDRALRHSLKGLGFDSRQATATDFKSVR